LYAGSIPLDTQNFIDSEPPQRFRTRQRAWVLNPLANKSFLQCPIKLDIKNQARVHLWYKDHFGYDIKPFNSIEDAVNTWPTTATSIGVRLENGNFIIYAPFGLNDLFGMIVRANKAQITEEIYLQKVNKWKTKWPALTIIPW
jgi:hypothetical protein